MTTTAAELSSHPQFVAGTWKLDPTHSELAFTIRHLAISKVRGTFDRFDVTVVTSNDPAENSVEATVDVASVNTRQDYRDQHLRTGDFFLAEEHPEMTFRSTGLTFDGDDFALVGDLTLRGVTKRIELRGELGGVTTDQNGATKAGASATTTLNRQDFGVSWNGALETGGVVLGDEVKVEIELQVVLQS